jgi:hypothetical protein
MKNATVPTGTHVLGGKGGFRTRMMNYLADPVLPVVTLLCISALTIAVIVVMVTAVATAFVHTQAQAGPVIDPWAGISSNCGRPYEDEPTYPGDAWLESRASNLSRDPAVARWTP